ncbi:MAG: VapE domain-containing protein [Eubacterium sp.]|uniref:VapE domain-containing protein n=1 Tax=Eubacterium sp. TaxID=142586 RepID=UPI003993E18F
MNNTVMNKSSNVEDADNKEIEVIRDNLKKRPDGSPRQTIENVIEVLNKDPMLKDAIRRNELSCKTDIVKKMDWRRRSKTFTDTDFNNIMLRMEKFYGITRDKNIKRAIDIVGNNNHYHPIIDRLESLEWDGKSRLRYLLPRYLGTDESDYIFEATRIMMMGAVHRVYNPGCKFEYMVCLVGGQGAGKSSFLRLLAMENEWFSDDLRKLDDDNVFRKIQGHWIIEMAEMLATCNARSVEDIKSFLSRQSETYKVPYETHPEDRPRQCIFVGSSNNVDFLPFDRTGNRRFVPVMVNKEKALHHPLEDEEETRAYIEQCWAEIMNMYKKGINTKLVFNKDLEKKLIEFQKECMPQDTLVGIIEMFLEMTDEEFVCVQMIYERALHHETASQNSTNPERLRAL